MSITVYYKYNSNQPYFSETFNGLTREQVEKIEKRYNDEMNAGDYVAMEIIIEEE